MEPVEQVSRIAKNGKILIWHKTGFPEQITALKRPSPFEESGSRFIVSEKGLAEVLRRRGAAKVLRGLKEKNRNRLL